MQTRSTPTGDFLRELRELKGLSPEEVPHAMLRQKIERRAIPSGRTIRRAEECGTLPQTRYRFGLAEFYGVDYRELWPATRPKRRKPRVVKPVEMVA